MGEREFRKLKNDFTRHDLPLDAVVVDTDWHRDFWHGFDWNLRLFPDPDRFARFLREHSLHGAFNVHPEFIPETDSRFPRFLKRAGVPKRILDKASAPHPFHAGCQFIDLFDKRQAEAYFEIFHRPIERKGCDLWWIDAPRRPEIDPGYHAWMNDLYARYTQQSKRRGSNAVLSRTYGLGTHRSTIVFTGDTRSQWSVLAHEVILTQKASNCLFAYTSHDIGGFYSGDWAWKENKPPTDLYVRWVQFGALSPMFRLHSDHGVREPWRFGKDALRIVRRFLQFRACLLPYLADLAREAHETGVGLCRPMYYEFPSEAEAYAREGQYMLGPAMLVCPVVNPEGWVSTWIPPGRWSHAFRERVIEGPTVIEEKVPLEEAAVYVREGFEMPYFEVPLIKEKPGARKRQKPATYRFDYEPMAGKIGV
jgi:alpha-glucosidase (family GH31 glycosyl hydrolase)